MFERFATDRTFCHTSHRVPGTYCHPQRVPGTFCGTACDGVIYHHHEEPSGRRHPRPHRHERFFDRSEAFGRDMDAAPRRFLVPSLLLLLAEKPAHGYALLNNLVDMGVVSAETPIAIVYRTLRHMEAEGLAISDQVEAEGKGPARKVYRLTEAGVEALELWSKKLDSMGSIIARFQKRYGSLDLEPGGGAPDG